MAKKSSVIVRKGGKLSPNQCWLPSKGAACCAHTSGVAEHLLRAALAYLFGDGQGVIDAGSDGGALQIITGQPEAREA